MINHSCKILKMDTYTQHNKVWFSYMMGLSAIIVVWVFQVLVFGPVEEENQC